MPIKKYLYHNIFLNDEDEFHDMLELGSCNSLKFINLKIIIGDIDGFGFQALIL